MKVNWSYIKLISLISLLLGVYVLSGFRSVEKKVVDSKIEFVGENNLFLTQETVNKLLIQKFNGLKNKPKDVIVLNTVEKVLEANEMVKNAQVYLTVNGVLMSKIIQRKPIGRIEGGSGFYLDEDGKRMPLSKSHSARVPIISGTTTDKNLEKVHTVLKFVNKDGFLKKNIIGLHITGEGNIELKLRLENYVLVLGNAKNLNTKFSKYKAFYKKAKKDNVLDKYKAVSLEFNNQVVCTKL